MTDRRTDRQTLLRRCGWVAQLSMRVCAMTDRHASTAGKLCTSNRQPGRVTTPTQNRSGKLHTHTGHSLGAARGESHAPTHGRTGTTLATAAANCQHNQHTAQQSVERSHHRPQTPPRCCHRASYFKHTPVSCRYIHVRWDITCANTMS